MITENCRVTVRSALSVFLAWLVGLGPGWTASAQQSLPSPAKLNVIVLEGENAVHAVGQRAAQEPVVQVLDEKGKPVAGASVLFTLPETGPGGTFSGSSRTLLVRTGRDGKAVAQGLRANGIQGPFLIQVEASLLAASAKTVIHQSNAVPVARTGRKIFSSRLLMIVAAAGAAAAIGAAVATRSDQTAGPSISISPGTPSVGGP